MIVVMDLVIVRLVLKAIAENTPTKIDPGEPAQAVEWIKERIRLERGDKGGRIQYNPDMDAAFHAANKAVFFYLRGDIENAQPFDLEALKALGGE